MASYEELNSIVKNIVIEGDVWVFVCKSCMCIYAIQQEEDPTPEENSHKICENCDDVYCKKYMTTLGDECTYCERCYSLGINRVGL